eukprot:scaffold514_cov222-Chaetoceros_neogracile.AAC.9
MLFATAIKKINRFVAPAILKHGLTARFVLSRGSIKDNPYLDYCLLLPFAQTLLSIEIQDIAREEKQRVNDHAKKVPSAIDEFVDSIWDKHLEPLSTRKEEEETAPSDNPRLDAFQKYLRPILTPTDEWSDIERFRFHSRFMKWLRSEYLICKYESDIRMALSTYTQLKVTPLLQKNAFKETIRQGLLQTADTSKGEFAPLPNSSTLDKAFDMAHWNKSKSPSNEYHHISEILGKIGGYLEPLPGSNLQIPIVPIEASVKDLSLEEILEVSGCHVSSCNAFNAICEEGGIYEFWTREYVTGLADYLEQRCQETDEGTVVVVSDGILAHFLMTFLKERMNSTVHNANTRKSKKQFVMPTIVAADNGRWKIDPKADVEKLNMSEALQKYSPVDGHGMRKYQLIAICSWMPMGIDWTQEMRDNGVDEYILIGECDDGNCGDNWLTFGNAEFKDDIYLDVEESKSRTPSIVAPYKADGFERMDLEKISVLQYSRFDSSVSGSSKTISFRRKC